MSAERYLSASRPSTWGAEGEDVEGPDFLVEIIKEPGKATPTGTFFNLANCAIGAGILGLPFAFDTMGIGLCIIFWVLVATSSAYTLHLLVKTAEYHGKLTYESLVEHAFGVWVLRLVFYLVLLFHA